jgi:hypothetical protein
VIARQDKNVGLQPRPERDRPALLARGAKQPSRNRPRAEGDGDLEREPDEEGRGRDEERDAAAVHDALDVLLDDERPERHEREDVRRWWLPRRAERSDDDACNRKEQ